MESFIAIKQKLVFPQVLGRAIHQGKYVYYRNSLRFLNFTDKNINLCNRNLIDSIDLSKTIKY